METTKNNLEVLLVYFSIHEELKPSPPAPRGVLKQNGDRYYFLSVSDGDILTEDIDEALLYLLEEVLRENSSFLTNEFCLKSNNDKSKINRAICRLHNEITRVSNNYYQEEERKLTAEFQIACKHLLSLLNSDKGSITTSDLSNILALYAHP